MKVIFTVFILLFSISLFAQHDDYIPDNPQPRRWFFGGDLGLVFGTITRIDVKPEVGYRLKPNWSVGTSVAYTYYRNKIHQPAYSTFIYGGSVFTRLTIMNVADAIFQIEPLNVEHYYNYPSIERVWTTNVLVGGGYRQQISMNSFAIISLLWNLNQTKYSPYTNPIFRIGFEF